VTMAPVIDAHTALDESAKWEKIWSGFFLAR
jgi:hypothetical protein